MIAKGFNTQPFSIHNSPAELAPLNYSSPGRYESLIYG
jgi:hypothetical protein